MIPIPITIPHTIPHTRSHTQSHTRHRQLRARRRVRMREELGVQREEHALHPADALLERTVPAREVVPLGARDVLVSMRDA